MVWKLCKIFRVRPTDDFFDGITTLEQNWLMAMVAEDDRVAYEEKLAFVEYLASFSNPEAVKKIIEKRKNDRKYMNDTQFTENLEKMFGRAPQLKDPSDG